MEYQNLYYYLKSVFPCYPLYFYSTTITGANIVVFGLLDLPDSYSYFLD